ncbi:MAG: hypothetical protein ABH859_02330 [Pseudomonadota bacterium]
MGNWGFNIDGGLNLRVPTSLTPSGVGYHFDLGAIYNSTRENTYDLTLEIDGGSQERDIASWDYAQEISTWNVSLGLGRQERLGSRSPSWGHGYLIQRNSIGLGGLRHGLDGQEDQGLYFRAQSTTGIGWNFHLSQSVGLAIEGGLQIGTNAGAEGEALSGIEVAILLSARLVFGQSMSEAGQADGFENTYHLLSRLLAIASSIGMELAVNRHAQRFSDLGIEVGGEAGPSSTDDIPFLLLATSALGSSGRGSNYRFFRNSQGWWRVVDPLIDVLQGGIMFAVGESNGSRASATASFLSALRMGVSLLFRDNERGSTLLCHIIYMLTAGVAAALAEDNDAGEIVRDGAASATTAITLSTPHDGETTDINYAAVYEGGGDQDGSWLGQATITYRYEDWSWLITQLYLRSPWFVPGGNHSTPSSIGTGLGFDYSGRLFQVNILAEVGTAYSGLGGAAGRIGANAQVGMRIPIGSRFILNLGLTGSAYTLVPNSGFRYGIGFYLGGGLRPRP